jgi:hypothetical protein
VREDVENIVWLGVGDAMDRITVDQLEALLRNAEAAHGKYEESLGHPDPNWPRWYAEYILDQVPEARWE